MMNLKNPSTLVPQPRWIFATGVIFILFIVAAFLRWHGIPVLQKQWNATPLLEEQASTEFFGVVTEISSTKLVVDRFFLASTTDRSSGYYGREELTVADTAAIVQLAFTEEVQPPPGDSQKIVIVRADADKPQATSSPLEGTQPPLLAESPASLQEVRVGSKVKIKAVADARNNGRLVIESIRILPDAFIIDAYAALGLSTLP